MVGPSGTGKSALVSAVARGAGAQVLRLDCAELAGRQGRAWAESAVSRVLSSALSVGGMTGEACILVIEDVDKAFAASAVDAISVAGADTERDGVGEPSYFSVATLVDILVDFFDGIGGRGAVDAARPGAAAARQQRVFVLGTTSRPAAVHPRLRRVGRFDVEVALDVPTREQRADILSVCLAAVCPGGTRVSRADVAALADRAHGYVGADLRAVCQEAALDALRRRVAARVAAAGGGGAAAAEPSQGDESSVTAADLAAGLRRVQVGLCDFCAGMQKYF